MGKLHWLILFPYYFFGAMVVLGTMLIGSRLLRLRVSINTLVTIAIAVTLLLLIVPLALGWTRIRSFGGLGVAFLLLASFCVAALDAWLGRRLPLSLDVDLTASEDH